MEVDRPAAGPKSPAAVRAVGHFVHQGVPLPYVATPIAIIMELGVGIAIALGLFVRPLAILLAIYTLATGLLGHPFWSMAGANQFEAEINFFKNVSIMSGLFLLYVTGAGRFSLDQMLGWARPDTTDFGSFRAHSATNFDP
jgi:putative oxidoreductase